MAEIDCQYLEKIASDDNAKPELVSSAYVEWLCSILYPQNSSLWQHLQIKYDYNPTTTIIVIIEQASQLSFQGIDAMSRIVRCLLDRSRTIRDVTDKIGTVIDTVFRIVDHCHLSSHEPSNAENDASSPRQLLLTKAYNFFQSVDNTLQTSIKKQLATLSHEICDTMISRLATLLHRIATASEELTARILEEGLGVAQEFPLGAAPVIVEEAWKFQVSRKCFLEGRMEIRIQGVESMQTELVQIHRRYIHPFPSGQWHPVVSFLCDFIVDNKLIDYLVGVESHPRLIRLTGNIVGFLVVCHRYTEAESDKIWNTVRESQDRVLLAPFCKCYRASSTFPTIRCFYIW